MATAYRFRVAPRYEGAGQFRVPYTEWDEATETERQRDYYQVVDPDNTLTIVDDGSPTARLRLSLIQGSDHVSGDAEVIELDPVPEAPAVEDEPKPKAKAQPKGKGKKK